MHVAAEQLGDLRKGRQRGGHLRALYRCALPAAMPARSPSPPRGASGRRRRDHRKGDLRACGRSRPKTFGSSPKARVRAGWRSPGVDHIRHDSARAPCRPCPRGSKGSACDRHAPGSAPSMSSQIFAPRALGKSFQRTWRVSRVAVAPGAASPSVRGKPSIQVCTSDARHATRLGPILSGRGNGAILASSPERGPTQGRDRHDLASVEKYIRHQPSPWMASYSAHFAAYRKRNEIEVGRLITRFRPPRKFAHYAVVVSIEVRLLVDSLRQIPVSHGRRYCLGQPSHEFVNGIVRSIGARKDCELRGERTHRPILHVFLRRQ